MKILPVILAGGSGSRLWPLSRSAYPKQFLSLINENETLLQSTVLRVANNPNILPPIIVCHEDHRFIVAEQMRQIGVQPKAIILEPEARNTAPAIALAAHFAKKYLSTAHLWVMPADHVIRNTDTLIKALTDAQESLVAGNLVTFGIKANHPETAYGYIKIKEGDNSIYSIEQFVENLISRLRSDMSNLDNTIGIVEFLHLLSMPI